MELGGEYPGHTPLDGVGDGIFEATFLNFGKDSDKGGIKDLCSLLPGGALHPPVPNQNTEIPIDYDISDICLVDAFTQKGGEFIR
jgi:hypothetical protein